MPALTTEVLSTAGIAPLVVDLPEGVEVTMRRSADRELLFVLNTRYEPVSVSGLPTGNELLAQSPVTDGKMDLGSFGCAIIRLNA